MSHNHHHHRARTSMSATSALSSGARLSATATSAFVGAAASASSSPSAVSPQTLLGFMKDLSAEVDTPAILSRLASIASEVLKSHYTSVYFVDHERGELILKSALNASALLDLVQGIEDNTGEDGSPASSSSDSAGSLASSTVSITRIPLSAAGISSGGGILTYVADSGTAVTTSVDAENNTSTCPHYSSLVDDAIITNAFPGASASSPPAADADGSSSAVAKGPAAVLVTPVKDPSGAVRAVLYCVKRQEEGGSTASSSSSSSASSSSTAAAASFGGQERLQALSVVTEAAGLNLFKALLLDEAIAARKATEALGDVVRIVHDCAGDDLETLTGRLVEACYRLVDAERITLFLVDELSGELFCQEPFYYTAAYGVNSAIPEGPEISSRIRRIPLGAGICGSVAVTGETVNTLDAPSNAKFSAQADDVQGVRAKSMLCLPVQLNLASAAAPLAAAATGGATGLFSASVVTSTTNSSSASSTNSPSSAGVAGASGTTKTVAVVQAVNRRGGGAFTRSDEELLRSFAAEIATLLDRKALQLAYNKALLADNNNTAAGVNGGGSGGLSAGGGGMSSLLTQFLRSDQGVGSSGPAGGGAGMLLHGGGLAGAHTVHGSSGHNLRADGAHHNNAASGLHSRVNRGSVCSSRDSNLPAAGLASRRGSVAVPHTAQGGAPSATAGGTGIVTLSLGKTGSQSSGLTAVSVASSTSTSSSNSSATAPAAPASSSSGSEAAKPSPAAATSAAAAAPAPAAAGGAAAPPSTPALKPMEAPSSSPSAASSAAAAAAPPAPAAATSAAAPAAATAAPAPVAAPATGAASGDASATAPSSPASISAVIDEKILRPWLVAQPLEGRKHMARLVTEWDFDVLDWTDGELVTCMVDMLQHFNLPSQFKLDMQALTGFLHDVRRGYRANPYHNFKHGVSVAHVCFVAMARSFSAAVVLSPLDRLATLLSAVCHDVDHRGMNNAFETNSLSPLALRYNDQSVLEMHHAATMFQLLRSDERKTRQKALPPAPPSDVTTASGSPSASGGSDASGAAATPAPPATETVVSILGLPTSEFAAFRKMCIAGILATDMTHHNDLTDACRRLSAEASRDMQPKLLVELLVHSADLCNPILPAFRSVHAWAVMVCAEFSAQVTAEKSRGLPFLPHMDGLHTEQAVAKLQCGFIDYVVAPLWNALGTMLPEIGEAKASMVRNRAHWKSIVDGNATPASIVEQEEKDREKKLQEDGRAGLPGSQKRGVFVLEDFSKQHALEIADVENGVGTASAASPATTAPVAAPST